MKLRCCFALICISITAGLGAQGAKLKGTVRDAQDNSALFGAAVSLAPVKDTSHLYGVLTDASGAFVFNYLSKGTYMIKVSFIGYAPLIRYLRIDSSDKDIGNLRLKTTSDTFHTITVEAKAVHIEQKNDTTEYNAQTFKTNPDATAEDLLNKMPGISSSNGTVTAHGETVQKVLVDGKEFFGDDATAAIKNLPAEIVDKVQVFDRLSDQSAFTGFDDGNSAKTINITTKRGKNNGVFGKLYAGYGYLDDSRFNAGGNINYFDGPRRISLIGLSNDINQQNFSSQDLLGVMGGGGRGGRGAGGSAGNNFLVGNQGGLNTTHSAGLNYIDVWGKKKKVKVAGSYFFNQSDNTTLTTLSRQYYVSDKATSLYNENDTSNSRNRNQRVNLRIEYAVDSMNTLVFTPKFIWQQNTQYFRMYGQNQLGNREISHTASDQYGYNSGYQVSGDVLYQHKFAQRFKTFSIDVGTSISNKQGNGSQDAYSFYDTTGSYAPLDQRYLSYNHSYTLNANLALTDPAGTNGMLQFNYTPSYTWNKSDQETDTLNHATAGYNLLDTILSDKYNNTYFTQKAGMSYRYHNQHVNAMIGVNGQQALLSGQNIFPFQYSTRLSFLSVLPSAMFNYKFADQSTLRIYYRTGTSPPSITQLQSVINNSNPLLLSTGNPNLNESYTNTLTIRYGFAKGSKSHSFFVFANVSNTMDYVANSTIIADRDTTIEKQVLLHRGSQFSLPVNINGYWSANTLLTYGIAVDKLKCNLNFSAGASYNRTPGLINNDLSLSSTYAPNGGIVISSNISEKIDYTISYNATYNVIKNNIQTNANNNYFNHSASLKFNWLFWKGFVFNTSLQNSYYNSGTQNFKLNIFIWNAALGYKFLKDKSLDIRISANDLLNQNSGLSRTVSQTYVEDDRSRVLGRYLLLTATWTLRYFKNSSYSGYKGGGGPGGYGGYGR